MHPKAKINNNAIIFSTAEKAADPMKNMSNGMQSLNAGTDVFILETSKVNERTVYKISAGNLVGHLMKQYLDIDGPKIVENAGAELFDRSGGRNLTDTDVLIQFDSPIWVMSGPEQLIPPGGKPDNFVRIRYWDEDGYSSEGYIRVSALNRL